MVYLRDEYTCSLIIGMANKKAPGSMEKSNGLPELLSKSVSWNRLVLDGKLIWQQWIWLCGLLLIFRLIYYSSAIPLKSKGSGLTCASTARFKVPFFLRNA